MTDHDLLGLYTPLRICFSFFTSLTYPIWLNGIEWNGMERPGLGLLHCLRNNSVGLMGGTLVHKIHIGKHDEHGLILLWIYFQQHFCLLDIREHRLGPYFYTLSLESFLSTSHLVHP
jgi:hypothetical protein